MLHLVLALVACTEAPPPPAPPAVTPPSAPPAPAGPKNAALFGVLPDTMPAQSGPATKEQIDLGRILYYDQRLSKSQEISCNTCHLLDKYGVDGLPTSKGHKDQPGTRNSPTTYNAALQFVQFWDGRAASVEEQAKAPVLNPVEMAMPDEAYVLKVLTSMPQYGEAFKAAFPADADPVTIDNAAKALGAFERGLVTKNSKFDQYMGGKLDAMSAEELAGMDTFVNTGCTTCHSGVLLGGAMYQKMGLVTPYEGKDVGRMDVTKSEADKYFFKVPQLRNVAKTAPYFHDGSVTELSTAVKDMGKLQLGKDLTDAEVKSIVTFLDTLTGDLPTEYIAPPKLPAKGPKTPKPDKS